MMVSCKKEKSVKNNCTSVTPTGNLVVLSPDEYSFKTSGGAIISISLIKGIQIKHEAYSNLKLELWGETEVNGKTRNSANHETLNGKHIKDRIGTRRTIIFPDGAKITMVTESKYGPLLSVTIIDGAEVHRINANCSMVEQSEINQGLAKQIDDAEPDGETGTIEITATGLLFVNTYTEETPGKKLLERIVLGELFLNNLNHVKDYYDDPNLGHT